LKSEQIAELLGGFEGIARVEQGIEYWFARDLQPLLGYERWENFVAVLERARAACSGAGQVLADHFRDVTKMVGLGSSAMREIQDVALTRYACYLIAQNGDSRKIAVAFAQTYFALQTRRQELIERRLVEVERIKARARLVESEKGLSQLIYERSGDSMSFARIRSQGDQVLFGGLSTREMKQRLGVPGSRPLAGFLPTVTIKAKDLVNEITIHNAKEHGHGTETAITREHLENSREVRKVLGKRGIKPEELPPAEDVKRVERRLRAEVHGLPGRAPRLKRGGKRKRR
jgi:DNA-damage-inducible protein D